MKTVLITGANKGIGFETAKQMAVLGYFIYLGSRDKANGFDAVERLKGLGISNAETIEIDVTNINSIKQARQQLETTKIEALDVLINNAAIAGEQPQNISAGELENLRNVFETNFFGAVQNSVTPGFTATSLNQYKGIKTVEQGARAIVKYATLTSDGATGKFFKEEGEIPW